MAISPLSSQAARPISRPAVPVTGQGVTIGVIDAYDEATGEAYPHARAVESTAGVVAPDSRRQLYSMTKGGSAGPPLREDPQEPLLPADLPDDPAVLDQALHDCEPTVLEVLTTRLNQLADDPHRDPSMRVINMSISGTRGHYYEMLHETLTETLDDGSFRYPGLRREVLGEAPLEPLEELRRIARYTDARLDDPDSAYSQALDRYQDTTHRLASAPYNIQLVVAAANLGPVPVKPDAPTPHRVEWETLHPGSLTSDLTRSPDVISVGAYDANMNAIWERTSRGDGLENTPGNPTMLLAPGNGTRYPHCPSTSAAAPYVSGTLALMLDANPSLTPGELRGILAESSTPLPGVEPRAQGAGLLDAAEAVRRAQEA